MGKLRSTYSAPKASRRVYIQLDGEPVAVSVKAGQAPRAATVRALARHFGADVTLWPEGRTASGVPGESFAAKWYDPKTEVFREAHVEIWDSESAVRPEPLRVGGGESVFEHHQRRIAEADAKMPSAIRNMLYADSPRPSLPPGTKRG